jgi:uncharacterized membrane protein
VSKHHHKNQHKHQDSAAAPAPETSHGHGDPLAFRMRGEAMSRIDAFSDVVFGFALTLLVVSLEVPHTFTELMAAMKGFVAFAICFAFLIIVWLEHYRFFRRYGLHDGRTMLLNILLLFVVLFYVYPLKFLLTVLVAEFSHGSIAPERLAITGAQFPTLMAIYGLGFTTVYVLYTLMYLNAWRQRDELRLNELEQLDTRHAIQAHCATMAIGLLSISFATIGRNSFLAGMTYNLLPVVHTALGFYSGRRRRKLEQQALAKAAHA